MKKISLSLIAVLLIGILTGCDASGTPSSNPTPNVSASVENETIEISVVTSYGGDDGNRQSYEKAVREYEDSSGIIVRDESGISNEEWKSRIIDSFETGTEPDILFYFTGVDSNKLIKDGKVVSLDEIRDLYPDYASNMRDDLLAKSSVDGKSYAVPVNGYWEGLFVNKKVLADCGVQVPDANTTWEQFLDDCGKIAAKGYVPIAASLYEVPHYWFEFCVFNNGSHESHAKRPLSSADEIGNIWNDGLHDIKDIYERGFFPENTTSATGAEMETLIVNDKAAFMIDGSWKLGWFAENAADINDFTVTYVPGKGERRSTDIVGGLSMGYFITRKAWDNPEKQAACVEFVKAMTSDKVVATFGATAVTALKSGLTPPADANSLVKDALAMTGNITGIVAATQDGLSLNSRSDLFSNVRNIVTGSMTADEAIDHCLAIE